MAVGNQSDHQSSLDTGKTRIYAMATGPTMRSKPGPGETMGSGV